MTAEEAGGHDYNDEAEEEEGLGPRQSSGMSHQPDLGGDDAEGNRSRKRRPMKGGSARTAVKGNRRRRLDEEDEQAEEMRVNRKRKRGQTNSMMGRKPPPPPRCLAHTTCCDNCTCAWVPALQAEMYTLDIL